LTPDTTSWWPRCTLIQARRSIACLRPGAEGIILWDGKTFQSHAPSATRMAGEVPPKTRRRRPERGRRLGEGVGWATGPGPILGQRSTPMSAESAIAELIRRVRGGDEAAAAELVRRYEPVVRRSARLRLNPRLRRACDSLDICQAVLGSFF